MAERTHTGTGAGANVAHEKPIVKKEVVKEHPEVVHKEHHVQPIIHEKERHVQPIHKTEVTKEHPVEHRVSLLLLSIHPQAEPLFLMSRRNEWSSVKEELSIRNLHWDSKCAAPLRKQPAPSQETEPRKRKAKP